VDPRVVLRNVHRRAGSQPLLEGIHVRVQAGEVLAIIGPSGAGKTTLGRVLAGLDPPDRGSVAFGTAPHPARRAHYLHQGLGVALNPRRTVAEHLQEVIDIRGAGTPADWMTRVGLSADLLSRLPSQLSGGQRQRASLARIGALGPGVIVLDEPLSGADADVAELLELEVRRWAEQGAGVVLISHDFGTVDRLAHRSVVVWRGRIVEEGTTVLQRPRHPVSRAWKVASRRWQA
jgi:peptide/nickel transport system ATP-binding protein